MLVISTAYLSALVLISGALLLLGEVKAAPTAVKAVQLLSWRLLSGTLLFASGMLGIALLVRWID